MHYNPTVSYLVIIKQHSSCLYDKNSHSNEFAFANKTNYSIIYAYANNAIVYAYGTQEHVVQWIL